MTQCKIKLRHFYFQVDPYSVAAKDGRIREGDQIVQVCDFNFERIMLLNTTDMLSYLLVQVG